jgi:hypothetical protein
MKEGWVCGRVERDSVKHFLVPLPDFTAETLMALINAWIEPGTTLISDGWALCHGIPELGFTHQGVNDTIGFIITLLAPILTS